MKKQFANISCAKMLQLIGLQKSVHRHLIDNDVLYEESFFVSAPIRLYILLHFYADTRTGIVNAAPVDELCDQLEIHPKTLRASIKRLAAAGYISAFSGDFGEDYTYTTYITDYKDMFLPMGMGGGGYFTANEKLLQKVMQTKQVNHLRILIRVLIETYEAERRSAAKRTDAVLSYRQIRSGLPSYLKPCIIKTALNALGDMFTGIKEIRKRITISLDQSFHGGFTKQTLKEAAVLRLSDAVADINKLALDAEWSMREDETGDGKVDVSIQERYLKHGVIFPVDQYRYDDQHKDHLPRITLSDQDLNDVVLIAQDSGIDTTIRAIWVYYAKYMLGGLKDKMTNLNLGGLIRSIAKELQNDLQAEPAPAALN